VRHGLAHDVVNADAAPVPPARGSVPDQATAQGDLHGRAGEFASRPRAGRIITIRNISYPSHATI
jgi:hypothetical protein